MQLLSGKDIITGNEYFRQKEFCPYDGDNFAISTFISKWASIRYLLGPVWLLHQLKELDKHDDQYPYDPTFLKKYEFVQFSSKDEMLLTDIMTDEQMKETNGRMFECFRIWDDWAEFYISTLSEKEIEKIKNTPDNLCPSCDKGVIIKKNGRYGSFYGCSNFPKCKYVENKLHDLYHKYEKRNSELKKLKEAINARTNNN